VEIFKLILDTFGSAIIVPIIVFILSVCLRVKAKTAFQAALYMGAGLVLFNIILGALMSTMGSQVALMVSNTGVNLPGIDVGWAAGAVIVYANTIGMFYLVFGVVFNLILFFVKWTDTFQPTDIWNYYQFVFWGAIVQFVTSSFWLGLACAAFMNLVVLLLADLVAPSLQEHYGYDGVTSTCICAINAAPFAILIRWLMMKIHLDRVHLDPESLRQHLGFFGEPLTIGAVIGCIVSLVANFSSLNTMAGWATVLTTGLTTGAIMAVIPSVSGLFVKGLIPISQSMNTRMRSGKSKRKEFFISIDPAVFFGESANLAAGLLLMPIILVIAIVQPGNRMLPLADLVAMPFMVISITAVMRGNILGTVIAGALWYTLGQALNSTILEIFTQAAAAGGVAEAAAGSLISAWSLGVVPWGWLGYKAFTSGVIGIIIAVVVYLLVYFLFRRNKRKWQMAAGASEEFMNSLAGSAEITV
jgi:PTS system galactitol-specific IIC component